MANIVNPDNTAPEEPSDLDLHYFFRPSCLNISFTTGKFWIIFLSSADFFSKSTFSKAIRVSTVWIQIRPNIL